MGMGGFDDFSFGLASSAQDQRAREDTQASQMQTTAQGQTTAGRSGDSALFEAISPSTSFRPGLYGDGILDQTSQGTRQTRPTTASGNSYAHMQVDNDVWLSPSDQWTGFNLTNSTANNGNGPGNAGAADGFGSTNGRSSSNQDRNAANGNTNIDATNNMNAAAMLKHDQSAITAALMKFMADMRSTNTSGI
jgi:hypothetical protein